MLTGTHEAVSQCLSNVAPLPNIDSTLAKRLVLVIFPRKDRCSRSLSATSGAASLAVGKMVLVCALTFGIFPWARCRLTWRYTARSGRPGVWTCSCRTPARGPCSIANLLSLVRHRARSQRGSGCVSVSWLKMWEKNKHNGMVLPFGFRAVHITGHFNFNTTYA